MSNRDDWQRDNWVENNCPKTDVFARDIVKHFMKMAYEQGRLRQVQQDLIAARERLYDDIT